MSRLFFLFCFALVGCNKSTDPGPIVLPAKEGLQVNDIQVGQGREAKSGDVVVVHYTGWLKNGMKFDSSVDRREPFDFHLGKGQVIPGWDFGVAGMKVGGKRKLIIPSHMAYGDQGQGKIPPNSELHFDVELLEVR